MPDHATNSPAAGALLAPRLTLVSHTSVHELRSIAFPVRPSHPDQRAYLDVVIGLRQVLVHADREFQSWDWVIGQDSRFEIDRDTTGPQIADALEDRRTIKAIQMLISPPPLIWPRKKADAALMTGMENFDMAVNGLIEALSRHLTVLRPQIEGASSPSQTHNIPTQPSLF